MLLIPCTIRARNEKKHRIRVLDNTYDALVATAFLDHYGRRLDRDFLEVSCGNRINPQRRSEYIYVYFWYAWYHRFILPLLRAVPQRYRALWPPGHSLFLS